MQKNQEETKIFLPIVPVIDEEMYGEEAKVIETIVNDKVNGVKNLGIIAPYGAGKSSVLATYKERNAKNQKKGILNISLASFNEFNPKAANKTKHKGVEETQDSKESNVEKGGEGAQDNKESNVEKSREGIQDIEENNIEKSILQQMLYSQKVTGLPESRISRIRPISPVTSILLIILFGGLIAAFLSYGLSFMPEVHISFSQSIVCLSIGAICAFLLICFIVKYYQLRNIKFKDLEISIDSKNNKQSVLNKFLDEVIYFFEKTRYDVVIFEDLDRFENLNIFVKLRELNVILNNNLTLSKRGKIVFIYAIKDTMFKTNEEKSKFFDFIVPVLPIINPKNAREKIRAGLEQCGLGKEWLPKDYIVAASYFITDMRVLNNIINDCVLMLSKVKFEDIKDENETIFNRNLFSLMAYKNLNPQEFVKIQSIEGELNAVLDKAKQEMKNVNNTLEKKLADYDEKLEMEPSSSSWDNLKKMVLGYLISDGKNEPCANEVEKITSFDNVDKVTRVSKIPYGYGNNLSTLSIHDLNKLIKGDTIKERERKIKQKDEVRNELIREKEELKEKANISAQISPLQYLMQQGAALINTLKTPFLQFLLSNGYFPERYQDYLSPSGGEVFLSKNDQIFAQNLFTNNFADATKQNNFTYSIHDPRTLIKDIPEHYFNNDKLLNLDILKELLVSHQESFAADKWKRYQNLLLNNKDIVKDFITFCCEGQLEDDNSKQLLTYLLNHRKDIFTILISHNLKKETIESIICIAMSTMKDAEKFCELEAFDQLVAIIGNSAVIYRYCADNCRAEIKDILKIGSVVFREIGLSKDMTEFDKFIVNTNLFEINKFNMQAIGKSFGLPDLSSQFSDIMNNEIFQPVRDYILSKLGLYVQEIMLSNDVLHLNQQDISILLNNRKVNLAQKKRICDRVKAIPYDEDYEKNVAEIILGYPDKVDITYEQLKELDNRCCFDINLICDYIGKRVDNFKQTQIENERIIYGIANSKITVGNQTLFIELFDLFNITEYTLSKISDVQNLCHVISQKAAALDVSKDLKYLKGVQDIKALQLYIKTYSTEIVNEEGVSIVLDEFLKNTTVPITEYIQQLDAVNINGLSEEGIDALVTQALSAEQAFDEEIYQAIENRTKRQCDLFVLQFEQNEDSKENFRKHLQMLKEPSFAEELAIKGKVTIPHSLVTPNAVIELLEKNNCIVKRNVKGDQCNIKIVGEDVNS